MSNPVWRIIASALLTLLAFSAAGIAQPIAAARDLPFGFQFSVDDGSGELAVFIHASTGINPLKLNAAHLSKMAHPRRRNAAP